MKQVASRVGFLLDLFFDLENVCDLLLRNIGLIFHGLHGVISQKVELFYFPHF
jgi:hypothetical protein